MAKNAQDKPLAKQPWKEEVVREAERQLNEIRRGAVEIISEENLRDYLCESITTETPLRIKLGVDPTAHDLHIGFSLPLTKLQIFSDLGHQPVLIIGDATAMVGDPSGRNKARPQLTREMVDDYSASYLSQAEKVLNLEKVEVRRNSEWLHDLGFQGFIQLAASATVAQILQREDFNKRFNDNSPIFLHELMYPLMQGYDSVVVKADVELGGQDQLFNLLIGRDLQGTSGLRQQVCIMGPLLEGLDGVRKMSKSFDNYIGMSDEPEDMFGKVMSIPDDLMPKYFELATRMPLAEIEALQAKGLHPRELKERLGREIVTRYYDAEAAQRGAEHFRKIFSEGGMPEDLPELALDRAKLEDGKIWIVALVADLGFAGSRGEARRLVQQGGVKLNDEVIKDHTAKCEVSGGEVLRVGRKRFGKIVLS